MDLRDEMNIDIGLFDILYYDTRLPIKTVARIMDISVGALHKAVTDEESYNRTLRTLSEANIVAMEEGRWKYPNNPFDVDWERVKQLRKEGKSFDEIGKEMGYSQGHKIIIRARKEGRLEDNL